MLDSVRTLLYKLPWFNQTLKRRSTASIYKWLLKIVCSFLVAAFVEIKPSLSLSSGFFLLDRQFGIACYKKNDRSTFFKGESDSSLISNLHLLRSVWLSLLDLFMLI